ncbi:MAG: hypothetical protein GXP42_10940 [Chloroflexi bacterium]|nr:hypothetical protein [Chloroflexota bacterium]
MKKTVGALLPSPEEARAAAEAIYSLGVEPADVQIVVDPQGLKSCLDPVDHSHRRKVLIAGAALGALVFGIGGFMASMSNLSMGIGDIMTAFNLTLVFVLVGFFSGLFLALWLVQEDCACERSLYEEGLAHGSALILVHAAMGKAMKALEVLQNHHAKSARLCEVTGEH